MRFHGLISLLYFMFQSADSFSDITYPYRHIDKYTTADYSCWYPQCSQDMATLKDFEEKALSKWDSLARTLWDGAEVVIQFERLETIFTYANYFNLSQCIQDFDVVLTLQKDIYENIYNVCVAEATMQNMIDYVTNMTALKNIIMYLDADTRQQVLQCGSDNDCKQNVESYALQQLTYEENRGLYLVDWYEKKLLFDNVNSVRECVEFKTFELIGDIKKIVNTVEDCLSYLSTIR